MVTLLQAAEYNRRSYCRSFRDLPGHRLGDHHRIHPADRAGYRGVPTGRGGSEAGDPGRLALVDGTLWPYWSWERAPEMWAGKYKTTGHGSLIISDEFGNIIFVSDPAPGCDHDMKKREGEVKEILDLAGSVIADKGFQGSGYVTWLRSHNTVNSTCENTNTITRSALSALPSSARLRTSRPGRSFSLTIDGRSTRFLTPSAQPSAYISSN